METALLVLAAAGQLKKAATRLFRDHRLSPAQFNVLHLLADAPAGLRAGELATGLLVDPSNITGLLRRLAADGLVADQAAPADGRSRVVRLTARGRARWQKANAAYTRELRALEAKLSAAEKAHVARALAKVGTHCDELLR